MALPVDEPPIAVDQPEAAVAHDAGVRKVNLVEIRDVQRLDRRDADADDAALHLEEEARPGRPPVVPADNE
jgi:hypothetical protein